MLQVEMRYSEGEKYVHRGSVALAKWEAPNTVSAAIESRWRMKEWAQDKAPVIVWHTGGRRDATDATVHCDRGVATFRVWVRG